MFSIDNLQPSRRRRTKKRFLPLRLLCLFAFGIVVLLSSGNISTSVSAAADTEEDQQGEQKDEKQEETGEEEDDSNDKYLYFGRDDSYPVQDYRVAPGTNPEIAKHAPFIYDDNVPARIVEFYAPWCPHCRHFRDHYVQFAKQITTLGDENDSKITVHAVSCVAHRPLCHEFNVYSYPKILLFKAGEHNYTGEASYFSLHPFQVMNDLGVHLDALKLELPSTTTTADEDASKKKLRQHHQADGGSDGAVRTTIEYKQRNKVDVFNDAHLSLVFALKNGVYMANGPLQSNKTIDALRDWIDLLQVALPPTWGKVQNLVTDLKHNFHEVIQSEDNLVTIVDKYPPPSKTWSNSCTHGEEGMGYTCGLWQLFHIITVGVVEWNLMISTDDDGSKDLIQSTVLAALTIRNFIENFFGCEVCRVNFVKGYDSCSHDRCHRLTDDASTLYEWAQLPVWLFESHNSVNVRLLHEKYEDEKLGLPTHGDEMQVTWPSRKDCPACWDRNGGWDDIKLYKYLRIEYWPEDFVTNEYREELSGKDKRKKNNAGGVVDDDDFDIAVPSSALFAVTLAILFGLAAGWYAKKVKRTRSGYHKKNDSAVLPTYANGV